METESSKGHHSDDMSKDGMDMEPGSMMAEHPSHVPWTYAANMVVGLWLLTAPFTFNVQSRSLVWSDVLSGLAAVAIAGAAAILPKKRAWVAYGNAAVGMWLLLAPLVFWAKSPAAFLNDTLCGALLIIFSVLVPMGMSMKGPDIPPGWTYNPSSWAQRAPIIALGLIGFFASRYMAAYQLGHIDSAWDPFFGGGSKGTEAILNSEVSKAWPFSDAGLGATAYLLEVLSGFMGDKRRWRTMPWMVAMFGVLVIPLGLVSITLIVMQPLAVGTWCTLCLLSAAAMLVMIPLTLDEVVAMVQFLRSNKHERGVSYWHTFWYGGTPEGTHEMPPASREPSWRPAAMAWGVTATWQMLAATALGVWLMFSPAVFGSAGTMANSSHLVGAIIIVVSVIAMAEVGRPCRYLNLPLGAWLVVAPWFLSGASQAWAPWNAAVVGVLVSVLSLPLGKWRDHYGSAEKPASWHLGVRMPRAPAH